MTVLSPSSSRTYLSVTAFFGHSIRMPSVVTATNRMGHEESYAWQPVGAPGNAVQREDHLRQFDDSVNAVSFGFVATAILISMFLAMAIFERFLRPTSPDGGRRSHGGDIESQMGFNGKLGHPSPKMTVYASGVSVLMPGDHIPTFIAHPAPVPCPPVFIPQPHHQDSLHTPTSNFNSNTGTHSGSTQETV
ncbi:hypothetical protein CFOL_v3_02782 [Cephalotus follicularis]|uniref:Uncharacterized protein n=1 Tax=Cephalotus follicularis TaxID=3775 RepID=A0A1Q3AU37_CEPFO|nr:hypothetical protein CFOL_v3_02782 [Cephalotus follicularis]